VRYLEDLESQKASNYQNDEERVANMYQLIVYGALGGRFDQTMSAIHALHCLDPNRTAYLISNESMAILLKEVSRNFPRSMDG
jgi:thiamine pyrophosphokinase